MTKEDIINYVLESPSNTNRAVLNSMLSQFTNNTSIISVKTIRATAQNPFITQEDSIDLQSLKIQLMRHHVTAILECDGQALGVGTFITYVYGDLNNFYCSALDISNNDEINGYSGVYNEQGNLTSFKYVMNGTVVDALSFADAIPSTLTIIYHPLEEIKTTYVTYMLNQRQVSCIETPIDTIVDSRNSRYFPDTYINLKISNIEGQGEQISDYEFIVRGECIVTLEENMS